MDNIEWFDDHGHLHLHVEPKESENGILFTAEYFILRYKSGKLTFRDVEMAQKAMRSCFLTENTFRTSPEDFGTKERGYHWSHDNHTALVCLSKIFGGHYHRIITKDWWKRSHPRDLVFYAYLAGGWRKVIALWFMWIPAIAMIVSCYQSYKYRGGREFVRTDGKKLAWVRFNTVNMPITQAICTWLVKRNPLFGSWKKPFDIYFLNDKHPNRNFEEKDYDLS